jgi:hypothetical protein
MDICPVAHTSVQGDCRGSKILQKFDAVSSIDSSDGRTSRSIPAEETSITEGPLLRLKAEGFLSDILLIEQQARTEWQASAEVSLKGQI